MRENAKVIAAWFLTLCLLTGCGATRPVSPGEAVGAEASEIVLPDEAPVEAEPAADPQSDMAAAEGTESGAKDAQTDGVVAVTAASAPELAAKSQDGALQVSDEVYRDIVSRTLQTAMALKSGEPIFDGIEDLLVRSPDYILDIEGMQINLERRDRFLQNVRSGTVDAVLVILYIDNDEAPVMVETCHYGGSGDEYTVEQIYAQDGKVVRKTEKRQAA